MSSSSERQILVELGETEMALSHASEDVRARDVIDPDGQTVGVVDELMVDEEKTRVRLLRVKSGCFLGVGTQTFLVPVEAISRIRSNAVYIDQYMDCIASAPSYEPDLVDEEYLRRLYDHFGYRPYWATGYISPSYPFYL